MIRLQTITGTCISHTWHHNDFADVYDNVYLIESLEGHANGALVNITQRSYKIPKNSEGKVLKLYCYVFGERIIARRVVEYK